jgi:hypothetical protein
VRKTGLYPKISNKRERIGVRGVISETDYIDLIKGFGISENVVCFYFRYLFKLEVNKASEDDIQ